MTQVSQDFFITAGVNLTEQCAELPTITNLPKEQLIKRWESQHGKFIIQRWKAQGFKRAILDEMVGQYHGHTDLRGIPLPAERFQEVDLSNIDFFSADLAAAIFENVNLSNSWLSQCNLRKTQFKWSAMEGVLIDDVQFDHQTSFLGVDLKKVNFNLATLLQENALSEQRIQHLRRSSPVLSQILNVTCDYGRSLHRFLFSCSVLILAFGLGFYLIPQAINSVRFWDCMFFSFAIFLKASPKDFYVTSDLGRLLFITEATIGYLMLGILVSILIRKTMGR